MEMIGEQFMEFDQTVDEALLCWAAEEVDSAEIDRLMAWDSSAYSTDSEFPSTRQSPTSLNGSRHLQSRKKREDGKPKAVKTSRRPVKQNKFKESSCGGYVLTSIKPTVFPSFEKTNFLLYLPAELSKCLNSADFSRMRDMLRPRATKNCIVNIHSHVSLRGVDHLTDFMETLITYHPDKICLLTGIYISDNTVHARFASKSTCVKSIFDKLNQTPGRSIYLQRGEIDLRMDWKDKPESDRKLVQDLIASELDIVVEAIAFMAIHFNDDKRIDRVQVSCVFTSATRAHRDNE